LNYVNNV